MQLSSLPVAEGPPPVVPDVPAEGPVLAQFSYAIRGPRATPKIGLIDAVAWPRASYPVSGSFDDAVSAAKALAATPVRDGLHALPVHQAHGVLQAGDGAFSVVPLGGFHRERNGPLFVDGHFFEAATLTLQVTRSTADLVAVVGRDRVLDLRRTGAAFVVSSNIDRPTSGGA